MGLAITQCMALTWMMQWGIRQSAEVVNQLMSVERLLEYTLLPSETVSITLLLFVINIKQIFYRKFQKR